MGVGEQEGRARRGPSEAEPTLGLCSQPRGSRLAFNRETSQKKYWRACLVVLWLRIGLATQGTPV